MANITVLEALQLSLNATKKYVDDKTEILPVKNEYVIFEDAVPRLMEDTATYGTGSGGANNTYIFDNLQNADMIPDSVDGELTISFNDGTEDITKTTTFRNYDDNYAGSMNYLDDFEIYLSYSENTNSFTASVNKWVSNEDGSEETIPCAVTKGTFVCNIYSDLIEDYLISGIKYGQISNVPIELQYLTDGRNETLRSKEYYNLYDNSFVWDMNKINERLDENSGVTQNTFVTTYDGKAIKVNQKDSEGIGFGQLVPITRNKNVAIFVCGQQDVIIKVYNPNTKELIFTMEDIYINSFRYAKYSIPFHKVRDIDNIFIAFTIKDIPINSFENNTIYDLIVIDEHTFLKKEELLTKANTKEYTPTEDYNPATKKYVDDKVAGVNASTITGLATVATSGSYNDLTNKPIIPSIEGLATETYVNNKVSGLVDSAPEALNTLNELATALGNDANFATTISNQIGLKANSADLATVATSGSYNDLSDKPTISAAYTHPASHPASMITGLHTVATSGDYNDLNNKPSIPTVTNDLTDSLKANYDAAYTHSTSAHAPVNAQKNSDITKAEIEAKLTGNIASHTHSQYLTSIPSEYITEQELTSKGYATESQINSAIEAAATTHEEVKTTVNQILGGAYIE